MQFKILCLQLLLWFSFSCIMAQEHSVSGTVLDAETQNPLIGVSVFYDGTSLGTVTDTDGRFELSSRWKMTAPLVIQYLGFETLMLENREGSQGTINLKPKVVELDEVVLEPDTWSREKKEKVFLKEFLGSSSFARRCQVSNLETVRLYYSKSENSLQAYPSEPLEIVNNALGYILYYDIQHFKVVFDPWSEGGLVASSVSYAGTARFTELEGKKNRYERARAKAYRGSILHFMRALRSGKLRGEKFMSYYRSLPIAADKMLGLQENKDGLTEVTPLKSTIDLLFDKNEQSFIRQNESHFFIDRYGNFGPTSSISFGGMMGSYRVAHMLPLDYGMEPLSP